MHCCCFLAQLHIPFPPNCGHQRGAIKEQNLLTRHVFLTVYKTNRILKVLKPHAIGNHHSRRCTAHLRSNLSLGNRAGCIRSLSLLENIMEGSQPGELATAPIVTCSPLPAKNLQKGKAAGWNLDTSHKSSKLFLSNQANISDNIKPQNISYAEMARGPVIHIAGLH